MLLSEVLPQTDTRRLARLGANTTVLYAIDLLRENNFVPLLIEVSPDGEPAKPRVVSGYSIVSELAELDPSRFGAFLESPAVDSSLAIGSIDERHDIVSLFHVFETTSLGYAEIYRNNRSTEVIASVKGLLALYNSGVFSSDLVLEDVASSPVFSLSRGARFDDALREMLHRKFRRIQIAGTRIVISDKEILAHLFQKDRLKKATRSPERLLDGTLEEIEVRAAHWSEDTTKLKDAAKLLSEKDQETILTTKGLITPWDLTIKPWRLGELRIADKVPK